MKKVSEAEILVTARVMHEAVRAFKAALGEDTLPHWNQAPKWMKASSIDGVKFRIENPNASSSAQHDQWMQNKLDDGWKFGKRKDAKTKTYPLLIPYNDLPLTERQKDALVAGIVNALTMPL